MSVGRMLAFLTVFSLVAFGMHYYVWARFLRDPALPRGLARLGTAGLVALAMLLLVGLFTARIGPRWLTTPVLWIGYVWLGLAFLLVVLLGVADLGLFLRSRIVRSDTPEDPARRQVVARGVAGAVGLLGLALGGSALASGLGPAVLRRVRVPLAKWPKALQGYRIVHITDVHVGPTIGRALMEDLVSRCNALEPDAVAITGDLMDGSVADLGPVVATLAGLRAKDGVFFVTGNHEYYSGVDSWLAFLRTLGIRVLRNERVPVRGDGGFDLAGVDDWTAHQFGGGHGMDLARATKGRDTARPLVLLAHQPKAVTVAAQHGVDLQLSGHTHGGQLFPFHLLVRLQQGYLAGLVEHGATKLWISRGVGHWGPPMRLGAPPEIAELELVTG